MRIRMEAYNKNYIEAAIVIWNEVVDDGIAFPQTETLDDDTGDAFFNEQSYTGLAVDEDTNEVVGLYILHPNNIGRCGHIGNASYAVKANMRGKKIGEQLVRHSIEKSKALGFRLIQFNAVVSTNQAALILYEKLGFVRLGTIPGGFLLKNGKYEDIVLFYYDLTQ